METEQNAFGTLTEFNYQLIIILLYIFVEKYFYFYIEWWARSSNWPLKRTTKNKYCSLTISIQRLSPRISYNEPMGIETFQILDFSRMDDTFLIRANLKVLYIRNIISPLLM